MEDTARASSLNRSCRNFYHVVRIKRRAMMKEWLQKKISREEAEAEHMVSSPRLGPAPVPFGFNNRRWCELLAQMRDGDELWTFSSHAESWQRLCGRAGIALVRRGKIVASIVTLMN